MPRPVPLPTSLRSAASPWVRRLGTALAALVAVALGTALGLVLTAAAIRSDAIGTGRAGPWRLFTDVGTPAVNPYLRARQARIGDIPLAAAQGRFTHVWVARDTGRPVDLPGPVREALERLLLPD